MQPLWKIVWSFLKKLKTELPYDPAIPLLGTFLKKTKTLIWKDICTPMFTVALFIIAKIWKLPKGPSTDEWIKKMWYIHTMEYHSAPQKNETMPLTATWMELELLTLSEISHTEKDKYLYMYILKNKTNEPNKQKQIHRQQRTKL